MNTKVTQEESYLPKWLLDPRWILNEFRIILDECKAYPIEESYLAESNPSPIPLFNSFVSLTLISINDKHSLTCLCNLSYSLVLGNLERSYTHEVIEPKLQYHFLKLSLASYSPCTMFITFKWIWGSWEWYQMIPIPQKIGPDIKIKYLQ